MKTNHFKVSEKTLLCPALVTDVIVNCQPGDVYIHEATGEVLFYESDDCWHSKNRAFANVLRLHFSTGQYRVVFDDREDEVCVKNADYMTEKEFKYSDAWQKFYSFKRYRNAEMDDIREILGYTNDDDENWKDVLAKCPYK